ncbi:hypothetical protein RvY_19141 [Ramazzottius varieornatus]|uniref:Uncharacterized protein n=1 Tax=Ramazzottius varieornatus TaxID=947166 RepID=A0A1D1W8F1_RAMVA|nr:hypothetical protein RvY_19141 [Ramazzottius varieornatus]
MASPAFRGTPTPPPVLPVSAPSAGAPGSFLVTNNVDHGIADSDGDSDADDIMDVVDDDGALLIPVMEVEAAAILENEAAANAAVAAAVASIDSNNHPAPGPPPPTANNNNNAASHPPLPPPPNPMGFLSRTWSTMHCGELMQDARLPVYSQFNRLASFRFCPISASRKMELAGRGWYCSGVNHELRLP